MSSSAIARVLSTALGVDARYRHAPKQVRAGKPIELATTILKWYEVHPVDRPIPRDVSALARTVYDDGALSTNGLGFVILHRCGEDFYFLITSTWRNENELWERVWYKDRSMSSFAEFPRPTGELPTYCVWELVPVLHEQQSWVRFLSSQRDEDAAARWLTEQYEGTA